MRSYRCKVEPWAGTVGHSGMDGSEDNDEIGRSGARSGELEELMEIIKPTGPVKLAPLDVPTRMEVSKPGIAPSSMTQRAHHSSHDEIKNTERMVSMRSNMGSPLTSTEALRSSKNKNEVVVECNRTKVEESSATDVIDGEKYDACISFPIKVEAASSEYNHIKQKVDHMMHFEVATVLHERLSTSGDVSEQDWNEVKSLISKESAEILSRFRKKKFDVKVFRKEKILFCLLKCQYDEMEKFASEFNFPMLLDSLEAKDFSTKLEKNFHIKPLHIPGPDHELLGSVSSIYPFQYIYAKYMLEEFETTNEGEILKTVPQKIYWRPEGYQHPFYPFVRLRLLKYMSESRHKLGMALKIDDEIEKGHVIKFFPLHNEESLKKLRDEWPPNLYKWRWRQPLDDVKDYFGVKIALYFAFIEYYNLILRYPAFLGLALQIVVYATKNNDHVLLPFYSVFILLWSQLFLDLWELKEGHYAMQWGVTNIESTEQDRSKFKGQPDVPDIVTGERKTYFSYDAKRKRLMFSFFTVFLMTSVTVAIVISLYILRDYLEPSYGENAQNIVSFINSVQIGVGNYVYTILAKMLTDVENHRTVQAYGDYLALKLSLFKFINSFGSFFYIAFVAPYLTGSASDVESGFQGKCGAQSCMQILRNNLAIIFISQIGASAAVQIGLPWFNFILEAYRNRVKKWYIPGSKIYNDLDLVEKVEIQHSLLKYDPVDDGVEDFAEVAMQFGFLTLFVPALPVAGVFAIFFNLVQIKIDGMKLMDFHQRPWLIQDNDIGSWKVVFRLFTVIAVFTNGGMVFFTMKLQGMERWAIAQKIWFFFFFLIGIWLLQSSIKLYLKSSKQKRELQIQERRQNFIIQKLFEKQPDDHYDNSVQEEYPLVEDKNDKVTTHEV